jgi:hypothetical protein
MSELTDRRQPQLVLVGEAHIPQAEIIAALEAAKGNLSEAAEALGVRRHNLARVITGDSELRSIHMDCLERHIDAAQSVVFKAVEQGNYVAATFVLSTIGKEAGWSTKQELTLRTKEPNLNDLNEVELMDRVKMLTDDSN